MVSNSRNISLLLKETGEATPPGKKIQLQFFIIPRQTLNEKKLTAESVRKLSYNDLIQTFGRSGSNAS